MKQFYHIRCDPNLYKGLYAMLRIFCACNSCAERLSNPWLSNLYKTLQPRYAIYNPKHVSTIPYYVAIINYIFPNWIFFKETTNPDEMEIKDKLVFDGMT